MQRAREGASLASVGGTTPAGWKVLPVEGAGGTSSRLNVGWASESSARGVWGGVIHGAAIILYLTLTLNPNPNLI